MLMRCLAFLAACLLAAAAHATTPPRPRLIVSERGAQPIELQHLSIRAELSGGMAETTVRMVFFNPNQRQLEGTLQFPLGPDQQVNAFALDINGALRPAVPVAKARGREVFEAIERRRIDPALLEVTQGNNFKLRVYPIMPRSTRTVEVSYAEPLARRAGRWAYRLPLHYGRAENFDLELMVNGGSAEPAADGILGDIRFEQGQARVQRERFDVNGSLEILMEAPAMPRVYREQRDSAAYFIAEIPIVSQRLARPAPRVIGLLWDSSGSGAARQVDAELAELERYFAAIGNAEVRLIRLRDHAEAAHTFQVRKGEWSALRRALGATVYDGASALNDWRPQPDVDQYLLFSDGLSNYGGDRFPALAPHQRLFAINSAPSSDAARLSALAERSGGQLVEVDRRTPGSAAQALLFQEARIEGLSASGATDLQVQAHAARDGMLRVAGRLLAPAAQLTLSIANGGRLETLSIPIPADAPHHPLAATTWAAMRVRALEADYEAHRAQIGRIGRQFGITTRDTSLIVLDDLNDYLRYDIEPPAVLAAQFKKLRQTGDLERVRQRHDHMEAVVLAFEQRTAWWNTRFDKPRPKPVPFKPAARPEQFKMQGEVMALMPLEAAAPAAPPAAAPMADAMSRRARGASERTSNGPRIGIALKKWVPNAPYMERLRGAPADKLYAIYLDEKPGYANSSAFYLDVADILAESGQKALAMRVLSNLAEMDLENRALLRILGYRLLQAGAPQLATGVFEKVLELAREEPQSYRDLGLAHAASGQHQKAVERLYDVVERPWDGRFPEIANIALAELNAIAAGAPSKLDTRRIDPRLLNNLPLDLRVVMTWDADNTDMDLWVTDPYGEKCDFAHALTAQGGRMSRDFTGGYGPEEFSLRQARPGKYRVQANYYGNQQQVLAGATTLQVKLFTGFGTARQQEQVVTLRLTDHGETVFVGEFEVR